jgi:hypothetical protein
LGDRGMIQTNKGKQAKPYLRPTLTIYGKVQDLTKANFTVGSQDNPTSVHQRTGV